MNEEAVAADAKNAASEIKADDSDGDLPAAIDREAMIEQMGAFDETTIDMLGMFVDMTRPQIGKIEEALSAGDFTALRELGHSLKGAARSACCNVLGDLAARLQDDAEAQKPVGALVDDIVKEFARVETEVSGLKSQALF